jgi:hypothetical protein
MRIHFLTPIGEKKGVIQTSSGKINGYSYNPDDVIVGEGEASYVIQKARMKEKYVILSQDGNSITFSKQGKVMVTTVREVIENLSEINYNLSPTFRSAIKPESWFNCGELACCTVVDQFGISAKTKDNKNIRIRLDNQGFDLIVVTSEKTYVINHLDKDSDEFMVIGLTSRGEFCDLYTISRETVYTNYLADGPRAALLAM